MKRDPMQEWVLREEILAAFHRWPLIVAYALGGMLLGVIFAYIWPAAYRASSSLSVELNPYRVLDDQYIPAFTEAEFRNIDDYKHWQMLQLSILVKSDPYLQETLNRLRGADPYWDSIELQDLQDMLNADWRNAGEWKLWAEVDDSQRASEAVEVWQDVILTFTNESIDKSRELLSKELYLRSLNDELVSKQLQQTDLEAILDRLITALENLSEAQGDLSITEDDWKELASIVSGLQVLTIEGNKIIDEFPNKDGTVDDYTSWIERVVLVIGSEINSARTDQEELNGQIAEATTAWEKGIQEAQGLSATLTVRRPQAGNVEVRQVRSYGLAALIGTLTGLMVWIFAFLLQVTRKGNQ